MIKIWQIKGTDLMYSDAELIDAIKAGLVKREDILINADLNTEISVGDCIYAFYIPSQN